LNLQNTLLFDKPNGNTKQDELIYDNVDGRGPLQELL